MNPARLPTLTDEVVDLPPPDEEMPPLPAAEAELAPRAAYVPPATEPPRIEAIVERALPVLLARLEPLLREALREAVASALLREGAERERH